MLRDPADDFDHPRVVPGHRVERHVLYRIDRQRSQRTAWMASQLAADQFLLPHSGPLPWRVDDASARILAMGMSITDPVIRRVGTKTRFHWRTRLCTQ